MGVPATARRAGGHTRCLDARPLGADLLPQIKQQYPDTEVIMLTAHDETKLAIQMLTQGAFGFLVKPVSWEDLVPQVRKALERRQAAIRQRQYTKDLEEKVREQTGTIA